VLVWNVKRYDCNKNQIIDYNVLRYKEDFIKRLKKICANKEEFSERLKSQFRYDYWSKSEHELIIKLSIRHVILRPWCGCRNPEEVAIDVAADLSFDWFGFANYHIGKQIYGNSAKIDIWDQLAWRWEEFVDYCWYTRLPYERKHEKFNC
jgi:hypothetical protein